MMEILRGSPALSAFRINKLLARFQAANLQVHNIYAEYVHFADLNAPLNEDEHAQLARLLKYGPALQSHAPEGKLLLVTPHDFNNVHTFRFRKTNRRQFQQVRLRICGCARMGRSRYGL